MQPLRIEVIRGARIESGHMAAAAAIVDASGGTVLPQATLTGRSSPAPPLTPSSLCRWSRPVRLTVSVCPTRRRRWPARRTPASPRTPRRQFGSCKPAAMRNRLCVAACTGRYRGARRTRLPRPGRFDTVLTAANGEHLFVKGGAEGVRCAGLPAAAWLRRQGARRRRSYRAGGHRRAAAAPCRHADPSGAGTPAPCKLERHHGRRHRSGWPACSCEFIDPRYL